MKCDHIVTHNGHPHNCGKCHKCRINYTSQWTVRLLYELSEWKDASFITLTYNDENLPIDGSLHLSHVQNFFDNLRHMKGVGKIRYYHCGEYGQSNKRPHYHIILFGLSPFVKEDREKVFKAWNRCEHFFFDPLPKNYRWSKSPVGKGMLPVERQDIAYTCGYVQKKLSGIMAQEEYGDKKRPYSTCSNYIGLEFALKNAERLQKNGYTFLNARRVGIPRYLREKLGIEIKDFSQHKFTEEEQRQWDKWFLERKTEFERKYPYLVPKDGIPSSTYLKLFEQHCEKFEIEYCEQIERDYLQKQHIRYGLE